MAKEKQLGTKDGVEYVDHPTHYNVHPSGVECIDIIEHYPTNIGLVFKHLWRAGEKVLAGETPGQARLRDLKKAAWYANREVALQEKKMNEKCKNVM